MIEHFFGLYAAAQRLFSNDFGGWSFRFLNILQLGTENFLHFRDGNCLSFHAVDSSNFESDSELQVVNDEGVFFLGKGSDINNFDLICIKTFFS